jgi:hypothetical protein
VAAVSLNRHLSLGILVADLGFMVGNLNVTRHATAISDTADPHSKARPQIGANPPVHAGQPPEAASRTTNSYLQRASNLLCTAQIGWSPTTFAALLALIGIWAVTMYATWGSWGNLTVDSGREIYVPAALAKGKMLYRDVWYPYHPLAPYLNSILFRTFGIRLAVIYWAGSLSALSSAIFLYLSGIELGSWLAGWTAGAVVVVQAFQPNLFCFPLPYSSAAVYGCLAACAFVWCLVRACRSEGTVWVFALGTSAATALLLKMEYGIACYATALLLIGGLTMKQRNWRKCVRNLLALAPGLILCLAVALWMISISGVRFITQENLITWPSAYFMKTLGGPFLTATGFSLNPSLVMRGILCILCLAALALLLLWFLTRSRSNATWSTVGTILVVVTMALSFVLPSTKSAALFVNIFFPLAMIPLVVIAGAFSCYMFLQGSNHRSLALTLLCTFAALLAFRLGLRMLPIGYAIYYDGPAVLAFLLFVRLVDVGGKRRRFGTYQGELSLCAACFLAALFVSANLRNPFYVLHEPSDLRKQLSLTAFVTDFGNITVTNNTAENYRAAISFMREKAAKGEYVLSVPEDTALYFLSGVDCPIRVSQFTAGIVAPGHMTDEVINEIEHKNVRYLIWSNEGGIMADYFDAGFFPVQFGTTYDLRLGNYLKSRFRPVRPLVPNSKPWNGVIWERKPQTGLE